MEDENKKLRAEVEKVHAASKHWHRECQESERGRVAALAELGSARAAAIEECAKVCDAEAAMAESFLSRAVDRGAVVVARETARGLAARLRALLETGS